ncbi:hypothetical protein [Hornefia butyriciproducens]|uniref:hypothetical protein n=1 Tax=Hornefia butyriciproducens TaxID=2652293 RepID=UPI003F8A52BA
MNDYIFTCTAAEYEGYISEARDIHSDYNECFSEEMENFDDEFEWNCFQDDEYLDYHAL